MTGPGKLCAPHEPDVDCISKGKGTLGDALHADLCDCARNICMILAHLRVFVTEILAAILAMFGMKSGPASWKPYQKALAA